MTHLPQGVQDPATPESCVNVTGVDRRTLDTIFQHPLSHNLAWREVVTLITTIGEVDDQKNGGVSFRAGGEHLLMTKPHNKDLEASDVVELRHFLTRAGWSPDGHLEAQAPRPGAGLGIIIVIDHDGATIHKVGGPATDPSNQPLALHILPDSERKASDQDRAETFPDDTHFFEQIARAVAAGGRIVVIGHGKGQSNEADHLSAYLQAHHKETFGRVVREIVADLPHLTTAELLELGLHALG
jgi:hypothetical protein